VSELKATPGDWIIRNPDEWTKDIVTYEGDNTLGEPMYWNLGSVNTQRDEADANLSLFRASKELHEVVRKLVFDYDCYQNDDISPYEIGDIVREARSLLSKLQGE